MGYRIRLLMCSVGPTTFPAVSESLQPQLRGSFCLKVLDFDLSRHPVLGARFILSLRKDLHYRAPDHSHPPNMRSGVDRLGLLPSLRSCIFFFVGQYADSKQGRSDMIRVKPGSTTSPAVPHGSKSVDTTGLGGRKYKTTTTFDLASM